MSFQSDCDGNHLGPVGGGLERQSGRADEVVKTEYRVARPASGVLGLGGVHEVMQSALQWNYKDKIPVLSTMDQPGPVLPIAGRELLLQLLRANGQLTSDASDDFLTVFGSAVIYPPFAALTSRVLCVRMRRT